MCNSAEYHRIRGEVKYMGISFRHSAGFGKRMEYNLVGKMLMEGLDVYMPLVDDHGVDCVIKREDGTFIEVQIKARSNEVAPGDAALFAAIRHELTPNFYFVFYSERLDLMWIMSSEEFLNECNTNKTGKNEGTRSIWFNGKRTDKKTGGKKEYCKERFEKYICEDFSRFHTKENSAPKTWLLSWNEDRWAWDDESEGFKPLKEIINQVGHAFYAWTCGVNKSIRPGDRIFMVKLGSEPRGIVASGHAVSGVYESPHWDYEKRVSGKMARRIQIDFDKIQDYTCDPIITYESLQQISEAFHWSIQASGVSIPEEIDKKLETLWKNL